MDTDAIEASGTKPIEPELERIAAISNLGELQDEVQGIAPENFTEP